jgi:ribosome-binding protein aMBF1 (putative translation factor)
MPGLVDIHVHVSAREDLFLYFVRGVTNSSVYCMQRHRSRRTAARTAEDLFGGVLREARKGRGFSQEDLAFKSGYHPTYIGQVERGQKSPSLRAIFRLAAALDTPGSELLKRVELLAAKER